MKKIGQYALVSALVFPAGALADASGAVTLAAGTELNLSTGATGSSGGDILWTGSELDWVGATKGDNYGNYGPYASTYYAAITQSVAAELVQSMSPPIPGVQMTAGEIFLYETGSGNYGKALVTATNGSSITLQYDTFGGSGGGGGGGSGAPQITSAVNNYSFLPDGFPNSGIAPSSIISIFGSGLAASTPQTVTLNSSAAPGLPTNWNGATVKLTVGSTTVTLGIYFAIPTQIAAVVPAGTPTGNGHLIVTVNNAESNAFSVQVVPVALGLDTYYGTGSSLVVATDAKTGALINYTNSAQPMEELTLWGSGPGADTADSDTVFTNTPHAVNQANTTVYFGSVQVTPVYVGSSGYPGLFQINVFVPQGVLGCNVSLVVVIQGVPSNFVTIPVSNGPVCSDSVFGLSGSELNALSSQSTVRIGALIVGQSSSPNGTFNEAAAVFQKVSGAAYYGTSSGADFVSLGSCGVSEAVTSANGGSTGATPLDAGNTITLQGPVGAYALQKSPLSQGTYLPSGNALPSDAIPSTGGAFSFSNGSGGNDVGGFTATVNLPNPLLTWTNQSAAASITRSGGFTYNWTGGGANSYVYLYGSSSNPISGASAYYFCYAPQSAGHFTIPGYILAILPAGTGIASIENLDAFSGFTAPGLDYGFAYGFSQVSQNTTWN